MFWQKRNETKRNKANARISFHYEWNLYLCIFGYDINSEHKTETEPSSSREGHLIRLEVGKIGKIGRRLVKALPKNQKKKNPKKARRDHRSKNVNLSVEKFLRLFYLFSASRFR